MLIKPYAAELALVIVGLAAAAPVVFSQTAAGPAHPSAQAPAMQGGAVPEGRIRNDAAAARPKLKTMLGTRYLCGGIGKEEADELRQQSQDYDLMLSFTAHDRSYLADVGVEIKDEKGRPVLQTRCDGPILLVDLPRSGRYRIRAEANHQPLSRTVTVPPQRQGRSQAVSMVLSWPEQPSNAAGPARSSGSASSGR